MTKIILPELGDGITKATMACWHVKKGDSLKKGQAVCEVVTDKASFVIDAPSAGRMATISVETGQEVPIGAQLATLENV